MEKKCIICDRNLKNSTRTVIGRSGILAMIEISKEKGDNLHKKLSTLNVLQTHLSCRNKYVFYCLLRAHYLK